MNFSPLTISNSFSLVTLNNNNDAKNIDSDLPISSSIGTVSMVTPPGGIVFKRGSVISFACGEQMQSTG